MPLSGSSDTGVLALIEHAVLAPSSHNTQPWRFTRDGETLELRADRNRSLPVNDPDDRELTISCGCALMNLRIAVAQQDLAGEIELLPDSGQSDRLARLTIAGRSASRLPEAELFASIARRRTYRRRFSPQSVSAEAIARLADAARIEGAWLRPLSAEASRRRAAALVAKGDAVQWANASWRRELATWLHPQRAGDGLAMPGPVGPVAQLVVRTFDMGRGAGARDEELAVSSPLLAIVGTQRDDPHAWLCAGQALQRVLLAACELGLQGSYLNQPVQVAALRPQLALLAGGGAPQILLRLGYPTEDVAAAPRRRAAEVFGHPVAAAPTRAFPSPR